MKKFQLLICVFVLALLIVGCKKTDTTTTTTTTAVESSEDSESFSVSIDMPKEVKKDAEFKIVAKVKNTASEAKMLDTMDISKTFFKGIVIKSINPNFSEKDDSGDTTTYTYKMKIEPGEEKTFELTAVAKNVGDSTGDFDFWTDNENDFTIYETSITVK